MTTAIPGTILGTKVGDRVRLVSSTDDFTVIKPGTEGVVRFVDDLGTVHVNWDDSHSLGLIRGIDRWEVLR